MTHKDNHKAQTNAKRQARQATKKKNNNSQHKKSSSKQYEEQSIFFASPVLIMIACPTVIIMLWMFCTQPLDTSILSIEKLSQCLSTWNNGGSAQLQEGFLALGRDLWKYLPMPTMKAILMVLIFAVFEGALLQFVPGKAFKGPISAAGDQPTYRLNAVACFILTHLAFFVCSTPLLPIQLFNPGVIYDNFGGIIMALTLYVKVFVLILYFKGRYFPSGNDNKVTGDAIYDLFWGIELYPRMFGVYLKQYVNCRLGMMGWSVIIVSFAWKQYELYGFISNSMLISMSLQLAYIFKFYLWESGYFHSIDIMHDRFGYYICWGCMCWITGFYTSPSLWFIHHPIQLEAQTAIGIFGAGLITLWLNWDADHQRQTVRATQGKCQVWGKPPKIIHAQYTTEDGKVRTNVLLASGWWGIARHFHYVTEVLTSFFWALPALDGHVFPYMYAIYLTFLLLDRLLRDEERCQKKYGRYWTQYCREVPYRVIPCVF